MSEVSTKKRKPVFQGKKRYPKGLSSGWLSRHVSILGRKEVLSERLNLGFLEMGRNYLS